MGWNAEARLVSGEMTSYNRRTGKIKVRYTPDTMGEIYEYFPSMNELWISAGIFSIGFLVFTLPVASHLLARAATREAYRDDELRRERRVDRP